MELEPCAPDTPAAQLLVQELDAYLDDLYRDGNFGLSISTLMSHYVEGRLHFVLCYDDENHAAGCGAVLFHDNEQYGELKRMFVKPEYRRRGIGKALLLHLENVCVARVSKMYLETGTLQPEAQEMYARHGFVVCGPFGDWKEDPQSVFMCKELRRTTVDTREFEECK